MFSFRTLGKAGLERFLDFISNSIPSLEIDLRRLSELLSFFVEHGRLPLYKLKLELLTRNQLESIRSTEWSLKELLEPCKSREREDFSAVIVTEDGCTSIHYSEEEDLVASFPSDLIMSTQPTPRSSTPPSSL